MTTTLFSTVEVAERLGLSAAAVAQAVRSGQLEPAARTADDLLFTERSITEYQRSLDQAAAEPAPPPPEGSRSEWASELGRLNSWLGELHASLVPAQTAAPSLPDSVALAGGRRPAPASEPPRAEPEIVSGQPAATAEASPPSSDPVETPSAPSAAPAVPASAAIFESAPPPPVTPPVVPPPTPPPAMLVEPAAPEEAAQQQPRSRTISRQAVLVVQPIQRFRTTVEIAAALGRLSGLADVRLEGIDGGVASYRLTLSDEAASGDDIAAALAPFGLHLHLVETGR